MSDFYYANSKLNLNKIITDHPEVMKFLSAYKDYKVFLQKDEYISIKNKNDFYDKIKDILNYITRLDEPRILEDLCNVTRYGSLLKYIQDEREVSLLLQIKDAYPNKHDTYLYEGIKIIDIANWLVEKY